MLTRDHGVEVPIELRQCQVLRGARSPSTMVLEGFLKSNTDASSAVQDLRKTLCHRWECLQLSIPNTQGCFRGIVWAERHTQTASGEISVMLELRSPLAFMTLGRRYRNATGWDRWSWIEGLLKSYGINFKWMDVLDAQRDRAFDQNILMAKHDFELLQRCLPGGYFWKEQWGEAFSLECESILFLKDQPAIDLDGDALHDHVQEARPSEWDTPARWGARTTCGWTIQGASVGDCLGLKVSGQLSTGDAFMGWVSEQARQWVWTLPRGWVETSTLQVSPFEKNDLRRSMEMRPKSALPGVMMGAKWLGGQSLTKQGAHQVMDPRCLEESMKAKSPVYAQEIQGTASRSGGVSHASSLAGRVAMMTSEGDARVWLLRGGVPGAAIPNRIKEARQSTSEMENQGGVVQQWMRQTDMTEQGGHHVGVKHLSDQVVMSQGFPVDQGAIPGFRVHGTGMGLSSISHNAVQRVIDHHSALIHQIEYTEAPAGPLGVQRSLTHTQRLDHHITAYIQPGVQSDSGGSVRVGTGVQDAKDMQSIRGVQSVRLSTGRRDEYYGIPLSRHYFVLGPAEERSIASAQVSHHWLNALLVSVQPDTLSAEQMAALAKEWPFEAISASQKTPIQEGATVARNSVDKHAYQLNRWMQGAYTLNHEGSTQWTSKTSRFARTVKAPTHAYVVAGQAEEVWSGQSAVIHYQRWHDHCLEARWRVGAYRQVSVSYHVRGKAWSHRASRTGLKGDSVLMNHGMHLSSALGTGVFGMGVMWL